MSELKKIQAFTLSEVLVAMVLMMIIIGMAMSVLSITHKNLNAIKRNISGQSDLEQLELVLSIDAHHFTMIQRKNKELIFSNPLDSVSYSWNEVYENEQLQTLILREGDTILSQPIEVTTFLYGKEKSSGTLDAIKCSIKDSDAAIFIYQPQDMHQILIENGF